MSTKKNQEDLEEQELTFLIDMFLYRYEFLNIYLIGLKRSVNKSISPAQKLSWKRLTTICLKIKSSGRHAKVTAQSLPFYHYIIAI